MQVWNDTVANLTLMALGSSAPEILLSCIEIVGNGFRAGELGPGTIVGSAAFNLFCITGVCILAVQTPETRRIDQINVRERMFQTILPQQILLFCRTQYCSTVIVVTGHVFYGPNAHRFDETYAV